MQRIIIFADEYLSRHIKDIARQEKRSASDIIGDALIQYINSRKTPSQKFSFIGIGNSGRSDLSERYEEILQHR
jgi:metal-responsive CopG/Arc/MetJ family transcriptional regulator